MANLFGFQITRASKGQGEQPSFILPEPEDGATTSAGFYSQYLDLDGTARTNMNLFVDIEVRLNIQNVILQLKI